MSEPALSAEAVAHPEKEADFNINQLLKASHSILLGSA